MEITNVLAITTDILVNPPQNTLQHNPPLCGYSNETYVSPSAIDNNLVVESDSIVHSIVSPLAYTPSLYSESTRTLPTWAPPAYPPSDYTPLSNINPVVLSPSDIVLHNQLPGYTHIDELLPHHQTVAYNPVSRGIREDEHKSSDLINYYSLHDNFFDDGFEKTSSRINLIEGANKTRDINTGDSREIQLKDQKFDFRAWILRFDKKRYIISYIIVLLVAGFISLLYIFLKYKK
ncbi:hypothetical protein CDIK_2722 [Cucumispora dikerogammari]|nr:hypothetical protein CDIK_2722 [Cucumispora dikerogammari]